MPAATLDTVRSGANPGNGDQPADQDIPDRAWNVPYVQDLCILIAKPKLITMIEC